MIGLVIVSHSHKLAEGIKDLAEQMAQGRAPIAAAGGLDETTIGTSAERIYAAIESVYQPDGVLVLMDLGSAVMSAELVLDLLPEDWRPTIRLSNAPIVEGAIVAATLAALGEPLDRVDAAARGALDTPKVATSPSTQPVPPQPPSPPLSLQSSVLSLTLPIRNKIGLHARPAAQFVQTAGRYQAEVQVGKIGSPTAPVNARSMFAVLGLNARFGDQIQVFASGSDADAALNALHDLVEAGFGEELGDRETGRQGAGEKGSGGVGEKGSGGERERGSGGERERGSGGAPRPGSVVRGIAASPGIAMGPAFLYQPATLQVARHPIDDPTAEWRRLEAAITQARTDLDQLAATTASRGATAEAGIFEAHQLFLADPSLLDTARAKIEGDALNAEAALMDAAEAFAQQLEAMEDEIFRQRAVDVRDVASRVARILGGVEARDPLADLAQPVILVGRDLTPSETAQINPTRILGVCTAEGGATSHTAILAKSLGLPAVVGLGEGVLRLAQDEPLIMDGATGEVWVRPDEATASHYRRRQVDEQQRRADALAVANALAITQDGHRVAVWANVGDVASARRAVERGAEGVGLLRTEFLFLDRTTPPSEEEQLVAYRAIADALGGRPVTVRTLDIGGDKPAPYLDLPSEANPFLGLRAIRLCLARPDLFKTQLRAILRASADYPLKIMFPMVALVEEMRQAKTLLAEAAAELDRVGLAYDRQIEVGMMVEIPSAALIADLLAVEADFFSLGTNDLVQYTFAADRGNPQVATLGDALHPAILRQIQAVVQASHQYGRTVSVCGEMASDLQAVPLLVGLGVDTLSVNPAAVPDVKAAVRVLRLEEAQAEAQLSLKLKR